MLVENVHCKYMYDECTDMPMSVGLIDDYVTCATHIVTWALEISMAEVS